MKAVVICYADMTFPMPSRGLHVHVDKHNILRLSLYTVLPRRINDRGHAFSGDTKVFFITDTFILFDLFSIKLKASSGGYDITISGRSSNFKHDSMLVSDIKSNRCVVQYAICSPMQWFR